MATSARTTLETAWVRKPKLTRISFTQNSQGRLHLPGPDFIDRVAGSDRTFVCSHQPAKALRTGRLERPGLPIDIAGDRVLSTPQGQASQKNPDYFDAEKHA